MNTRQTIRKIFFISMWLVIGGGMLTLLVAAIGKKNRGLCREYRITIKGFPNSAFVDEKDIQQILNKSLKGDIKGEPLSSINLHQLEVLLESNHWIKDAELFFDNRDVLHIVITEREPVARIFTNSGSSFYIDSKGMILSLSDKKSAKVPVFTGFPDRKRLFQKDSLLLGGIRTTAQYILNDPFWMAQVDAISITDDNNFEMIPVVGNHIVRLGDAENIEKKFHRLFVFYQQVLSKAGFDRYKILDVQYAGQVVALKQAGANKVDSVQLRRNVEKLLAENIESESDTIPSQQPVIEKIVSGTDQAMEAKINLEKAAGSEVKKSVSPATRVSNVTTKPVKTGAGSKPEKNKKEEIKMNAEKKLPKAIMPKKGE